jgi:hypothetical protein
MAHVQAANARKKKTSISDTETEPQHLNTSTYLDSKATRFSHRRLYSSVHPSQNPSQPSHISKEAQIGLFLISQ